MPTIKWANTRRGEEEGSRGAVGGAEGEGTGALDVMTEVVLGTAEVAHGTGGWHDRRASIDGRRRQSGGGRRGLLLIVVTPEPFKESSKRVCL